MNKNGLAPIFIVLIVAAAIAAGAAGYFVFRKAPAQPPQISQNPAASSSEQEAARSSSGKCEPTFAVTPGPELTASENYAAECASKTSKAGCESVDIYDKAKGIFGNADGTPDCKWVGATSAIDISSWKTYRNEKYGFELRYPALGKVQRVRIEDDPDGGQSLHFEFWSNKFNNYSSMFGIGIVPSPERLSVTDWFRKNVQESDLLLDNKNFTEINMPGGKALWLTKLPVPPNYDAGPIPQGYFTSSSREYIFVIDLPQDDDISSYYPQRNNLVNDILPTIKFFK